eukprot:TRINITY_DN177_c0_g1_i3.p1 TRINITY_DN177_c0_g1~~TRINITY_DN177_c0_g1_i3.p1  ORF type:complete len:931 (-),score=352.87 TRINITY_DN177_c0_g1_i3:97-2889(-)
MAKIPQKLRQYFDDGDPDEIFILEEEIASGSFGAVYKGRHYQNGKYYAVKIITPEEDEVLEDFMVEISVLKRCKHENIVGFFGSWLKGEELFIAMELCDGGAVSDIFQVCHEPLTEDQIALVCRETLKSLVYLHGIGIIHRDIKGANILLTNSGDIKLVDFGVSAELKKPGERRNTLIGTPYWMAPEVVANKTGNQPYEFKADLWSLGITLLELAEMNPPLHEIHPMKALMMIPMRDPPTFTHPDKWSKEFRDFITICLAKSPEKRKTAEEMMQHPFITSCKSKQVLIDLIQKRKKAEDADRAADEEEDTDTDSDEENASGTEDKNSNSKQKMDPLTSPVTPRVSTPELSPPASPAGPRAPTQRDRGSTSSGDRPAEAPKGTARGTARPGNPNRPTYRTNKKLTKKEIKMMEAQIISRQLLKEQLKEIRANQTRQVSDMERQTKQHARDLEAAQAKFEAAKATQIRSHAKEQERIKSRQKTDVENLTRNQTTQRKDSVKSSQTVMKQHVKNLEKESSRHKKEHSDLIKNLQKEHKAHIKTQGKSLSKKDQKVMTLEHNQSVEWQDLLFEQNQNQIQFNEQFEKHTTLQDENARAERDMLEKSHLLAWEHLVQNQKATSADLRLTHSQQMDYLNLKAPLEEKQLQEKQELQKIQLKETLQLENTQQGVLLAAEMKNQLKEHRKEQTKVREESKVNLQKLSRQLGTSKEGKASLKVKSQEETQRMNERFQRENKEFEEKQAKQKAEETEMIQKHQAAKLQQQITEHGEQREELKKQHEEMFKKVKEEIQISEAELEEKHRLEQKELLAAQHVERSNLNVNLMKQKEASFQDHMNEQTKLLDAQYAAQVEMKQKHFKELESEGSAKKSEQGGELENVKKTHEEKSKNLQDKLQGDFEALKSKLKDEFHLAEEHLAKEKAALENRILPFNLSMA